MVLEIWLRVASIVVHALQPLFAIVTLYLYFYISLTTFYLVIQMCMCVCVSSYRLLFFEELLIPREIEETHVYTFHCSYSRRHTQPQVLVTNIKIILYYFTKDYFLFEHSPENRIILIHIYKNNKFYGFLSGSVLSFSLKQVYKKTFSIH